MSKVDTFGVIKAGLMGAIIVGGVKYLSQVVSPAVAPMLGGAPIGIISAYFLTGKDAVSLYAKNYIVVTMILVFSILVFYFSLEHTELKADYCITIAVVLWIVLNSLKVLYWEKTHKTKKNG